MNREVVVIGGGTAGMEAAGQLSDAGCRVTLIEKDSAAGGHLNNWYHLFPDRRKGDEVLTYLNKRGTRNNLTILKSTRVDKIDKTRKKFAVRTSPGKEIFADAIVVATGFDLFKSEKKEEYGYGIYNNVITSSDLENKFRSGDLKTINGEYPKRIGGAGD